MIVLLSRACPRNCVVTPTYNDNDKVFCVKNNICFDFLDFYCYYMYAMRGLVFTWLGDLKKNIWLKKIYIYILGVFLCTLLLYSFLPVILTAQDSQSFKSLVKRPLNKQKKAFAVFDIIFFVVVVFVVVGLLRLLLPWLSLPSLSSLSSLSSTSWSS